MFRCTQPALGCNPFMMLMKQCKGTTRGFQGLYGPARAAKLVAKYNRMSDANIEALRKLAATSTTPCHHRRYVTLTEYNKFVVKQFPRVKGDPNERFVAIGKLWMKKK